MELNFIDFLKLPTKVMVALALAAGMILFLPDSIIAKIYMIEFRAKYGFIIGAIFIITLSILIITVTITVYNLIKKNHNKRKFKENSAKAINSLDTFKKAIIYGLYIEEDHTDELPLNSGATVYLENMMIIRKTTNQYFTDDLNNAVFPYMLQPWVIEKLNNDNELLVSFKDAYINQLEKYKNNHINNRNYY